MKSLRERQQQRQQQRQRRTNFDHKSLLEPSAQVSEKMCYYSQIINNMNIN